MNDTGHNRSGTDRRESSLLSPDAESQRARDIVETVCYAGVTLVLCVVGIPTNVLNCVVFWRQGLRDRMNLCLFSLAAADLSFLTSMFTWQTVSTYIRFSDLTDAYYSNSGFVLSGASRGFHLTAGFINMVIAVERCVCVVYPHRASTFLRTKTMAMIVVLSLLLFQTCYLIYPFSYCVTLQIEDDHLKYLLLPSDFYYENKIFVYMMEHAILGTVIPVTIFVILSVSTGITVVRLRAALRWRRQTTSLPSNSYSQQVALTSMLVIVSLIVIITTLPLVTRQLFFWFLEKNIRESRASNIFNTVGATVYVISEANSCIHFFVYYRRSAKFRMVLRKFLCNAYSRVDLSITKTEQTSQDIT